jgi:thioredoxin reductase (NADPH)
MGSILYEDKGVKYFIKDPEEFRDKRVVIAGGGDSAFRLVSSLRILLLK